MKREVAIGDHLPVTRNGIDILTITNAGEGHVLAAADGEADSSIALTIIVVSHESHAITDIRDVGLELKPGLARGLDSFTAVHGNVQHPVMIPKGEGLVDSIGTITILLDSAAVPRIAGGPV